MALKRIVSIVAAVTRPRVLAGRGLGFARAVASLGGSIIQGSITSGEGAGNAERTFMSSGELKPAAARLLAHHVTGLENVYSITVEGEHEYVANGILVANCDKEDRESVVTRTRKERWFDSLIPLLVEFSYGAISIKILMIIGTRWHLRDLHDYVAKKWQAQSHVTNYNIEVEGIYKSSGVIAFPTLFTEQSIAELQAELTDVFFACQYLNDPLPEGLQLFSKDRLHFVRPECYNITHGSNFCFFDPSLGKQHSDFPAVIWLNVLNGRIILFDAIDRKQPLANLLPVISAKNKETLTRLMVYETNNTTLVEETLYRLHKEIGYSIQIEGIHETRNKEERIAVMQPLLYNGSVLFRDDYDKAYPELFNQIIYYPAWGNDDFPDVLEKGLTWILKNVAAGYEPVKSAGRKSANSIAGGMGDRRAW
jgi:predicted phage terminase large subunit-like protein